MESKSKRCTNTAYLLAKSEFQLWLSYIEHILILYVAININRNKFCKRYIQIIFILACFSLFFYIIGLLGGADALSRFFPTETTVLWEYWGRPYYLRGKFLYTMRIMELERNNSIFTEPGLYQMFLNSSLFILIFMRDSITEFSRKAINTYLIVFIIALITTGSTTGYLGLIMIMITVILGRRKTQQIETNGKDFKKIFRLILIMGAIVGSVLLTDFIINKTESTLYIFFIRKILEMFSDGTSGHARTSMIYICMGIALTYPLGAGEDFVAPTIKNLDAGADGAILIHTFASIGIIPTLLILSYYFQRIFNKNVPVLNALLIIGLYLNTALAQSRLLYPSLLMLPIVYSEYCNNKATSLKRERRL